MNEMDTGSSEVCEGWRYRARRYRDREVFGEQTTTEGQNNVGRPVLGALARRVRRSIPRYLLSPHHLQPVPLILRVVNQRMATVVE